VLVPDCFPHRQSEGDDDYEDDQETPASGIASLFRG
jgi:hypothetical protein